MFLCQSADAINRFVFQVSVQFFCVHNNPFRGRRSGAAEARRENKRLTVGSQGVAYLPRARFLKIFGLELSKPGLS
jgi:hypothetical protein